ncbi:hypothetical protein GOBAR_DD25832 [Gossypium barbadense]|nr:hypothetical protein GOBAR_DD25832 [Gossypium barbadense]
MRLDISNLTEVPVCGLKLGIQYRRLKHMAKCKMLREVSSARCKLTPQSGKVRADSAKRQDARWHCEVAGCELTS